MNREELTAAIHRVGQASSLKGATAKRGALDWPKTETVDEILATIKEGATEEIRGEALQQALRLLMFGRVNDEAKGASRRKIAHTLAKVAEHE